MAFSYIRILNAKINLFGFYSMKCYNGIEYKFYINLRRVGRRKLNKVNKNRKEFK